MGELVGSILGSLLWTWLFGFALRKAGLGRTTAYAWGYLAMMTAAIVVSQFTGLSSVNLWIYGACGLAWMIWLAREPPPTVPARRDKSQNRKQERKAIRVRDSNARIETQTPPAHQLSRTTCPSCLRENEEDADYCVACGTSLGARTCPKCNTANAPDATYCKRCGVLIGKAGVPDDVGKAKPKPEATRAAFKCFDCGSVTNFGSDSCHVCGLKFEYSGDLVTRAH